MQDTINTDKDTENKNYMEKCKLTKTATIDSAFSLFLKMVNGVEAD